MKKLTTSIAILACVAAFTGCAKKSDTTKTTTTTATMTATCGGRAFSTSGIMITADVQAAHMNITGSIAASAEAIILSVDKTPPAVGTYPISGFTTAAYGIGGSTKGGVSGTIVFTSISPNWEGTFNFTCDDSTKVTDGKFSVKAP